MLVEGAVVVNTLIEKFGDILVCPDDHGILIGVFGVMVLSRALTMMMLVMKSSGTTPTSLLVSQLLYLRHVHTGAPREIGQGGEGGKSSSEFLG